MSEIQHGLLITVIGMGLVFAVIIFLWGLMALMMRLTSKEKKGAEVKPPDIDANENLGLESPFADVHHRAPDGQRRAVAAAVATALAIATSHSRRSQKSDLDQSGALSPWQSFHRTQNLENKHTRG